MSDDIIKEAIGKSFLVVLPSGWLGRPWDSMFFLQKVSQDTDGMHIEMSGEINIYYGHSTQVFCILNSIFFIVKDLHFSSKLTNSMFHSGVLLLLRSGLKSEQKIFQIYEKLSEIMLQP